MTSRRQAARGLVLAGLLGGAIAAVTGNALAQTLTIGVRAGTESIDPHFAAEDVAFSIKRIPIVAGPNPTTIDVRRVKDTRIVDPLTIQVIIDGAAPNLSNDFIRLFIVSAKAAARLTKESASEALNTGKAAIGTGPNKFVSRTSKDPLVLDRFDDFWGATEPWAHHVRKEIPNDAARVDQLKAGQVDLIVRAPASDVPTFARDAKFTVVKQATVYVFNLELDIRDKAPQVSARNGSPLPKNPMQDAAVEMDEGRRRSLLEQASELVARDRPRLPLTAASTAWAMHKSKVIIEPRVDDDTRTMNVRLAR